MADRRAGRPITEYHPGSDAQEAQPRSRVVIAAQLAGVMLSMGLLGGAFGAGSAAVAAKHTIDAKADKTTVDSLERRFERDSARQATSDTLILREVRGGFDHVSRELGDLKRYLCAAERGVGCP